ncbi:MAG: 5-formyltetrahydrofolate cyclo-ligase, partial [Planctomycetes bacterium]|nr:5-formyltetrahydrofolate cyclo-ligase [Planctomycetota bacterium]
TALRERIIAIPAEQRLGRSQRACEQLLETHEYQSASILMIFLSTAQEVDTSLVALRAWADGKRVAAPRVSWEQRRMMPIEIFSLTSGLESGAAGVREPVNGQPVPIGDIDLVIVPGLGFDEQGNRLGRGRGFYDRFLAHREYRAVSCALAFEEQVVAEIPIEENDRKVDMLVTDAKVRRFSS